MVPCWLDVTTEKGPLRAVAFVIDPASDLYVGGLEIGEVARSLAVSAGEKGTMAEYLHNTVSNLEALGVHDPHLWRLQELVAAELETLPA
jgi:cation transport protein ChaC